VVLQTLVQQFVRAGFCSPNPIVTFGLAAGKVHPAGCEDWMRSFFQDRQWQFMGPTQIRNEASELRDCNYENTVAAVVAKLLLR
jgi:hypothetical protein